MPEDFDMTNMPLEIDVPEDYDPSGKLKSTIPTPPPDGDNVVLLYLDDDTDNMKAVRTKGNKVVATFRVRAAREDGSPGQYMKNWYPTTQVFDGQVTSALMNLMRIAGKPVTSLKTTDIINAVYEAFEHTRGDNAQGFPVVARTQWVKSVPSLEETPEGGFAQVIDPATGKRVYEETKGESRIRQAAVQAAEFLGRSQGLPEEKIQELILDAQTSPHIYINPLTGEENSVRAEIFSVRSAA